VSYIKGRRQAVHAMRKEVIGGQIRLHNEHLHNQYSLLNIIRMIKIRNDEMGGECSMYRQSGFWWENMKESD
jgi:hypothetical protein